MLIEKTNRQFEIPYNFDKKLIDGVKILGIKPKDIFCFYMCPYIEDYKAVIRDFVFDDKIVNMSRETYIEHIQYIEEQFPGKLQLLLQQNDDNKALEAKDLQFYIDLGFKNFCCGTIKQAKIIKEINPDFIVVGSITMRITPDAILYNHDYQKYFDALVLDFSYMKDIQKIKMLPQYFKYIVLCNALCNWRCDGTHHWFKKPDEVNTCPGLATSVGFENSCLIRPMDLKYFDPYIHVYKIQDRGWPTNWILRSLVLYTTDYSLYPGIIYDEDIYEQ